MGLKWPHLRALQTRILDLTRERTMKEGEAAVKPLLLGAMEGGGISQR